MSAATSRRIDYLEGLRGLSALLIVLHHYSQAFIPGVFSNNQNEFHLPFGLEVWAYNTPIKLPISGSVWLFVFLILSGMVITYGFINKGRQVDWLKSLVVNRYSRLVGPIFITCVGAFLIISLGWNYNQEAAQISESTWWLGKQWQMDPAFLPMAKQALVEVFYKVLPIELAYNSSLWVIPFFFIGTFLLAGTLALGNSLGKWRFVGYTLVTLALLKSFYFPLILGIFLGEGLTVNFSSKWRIWGVAALITGIYWGTYPTWTWPQLMAGSWYNVLPKINLANDFVFYHAAGAFLIILSIMLLPWLQRILTWKGFLFLGKISFSLYVVHILLINSLASWILISWEPYLSYNLILLIILITCLPLTILLAKYLNKYVEEWMNQKKLKI